MNVDNSIISAVHCINPVHATRPIERWRYGSCCCCCCSADADADADAAAAAAAVLVIRGHVTSAR